jgi:cobalt-zinc-cadmium efflux system protein
MAHPHEGHQGHSHEGHEGHSHGVSAEADRRYLAIALALLVGFMLVEVVVGFIASSLALISDAGHMLTDAGAIALALVTMRLAARPARGSMTYGLKRAEILSAQANGITLLLLSAWFVYEAVRRLIDPPEVEGGLVLAIALLGIVVNLLATWTISKANRESLNVEGAFQHILTDLFAFVATAVAGAIIYFTGGYNRVDAIAALVVAALMLRAGYGLVRDSGRIFLEAAPKGLDPEEIGRAMASHPGVAGVHDLHVWEVTSGFPALSAHVLVEKDEDCHEERRGLERLLEERFGVEHTTLQVDHATAGLIGLSHKGEADDGLDSDGVEHPCRREPEQG